MTRHIPGANPIADGLKAANAAINAEPPAIDAHQPGAKLDAGKAPIMRGVIGSFPNALTAVAEVAGFGARKYTWDGWRSVPDGVARYSDAMMRHIVQEHSEGELDGETNLSHAAHAAWNALARLELMLSQGAE